MPNHKIVLVVNYELVTGDDQDEVTVSERLRDLIEDEDLWLQDEDHDEESAYGFSVSHWDIVDEDVAEVKIT